MKWLIFLIYWIALTLTMRGGALGMWLLLLPTFLLLWSWAEDLEEQGPAAGDVRGE